MSKPAFAVPDPAPLSLTSESNQPNLSRGALFALGDQSSAQDKLQSI
jgi:hypothetical protein